MNKLSKWLVDSIVNENKKITKVVGIYGGRYQPFGPHHKKTYEWLKTKVDDAYITTSDIKRPPKHPMNYKEKVRHMTKMGIPKSKIIKEKVPLKAENVLKKYNPQTTAVVYIFGAKDAGRLAGGKKKGGGLSYFQDFKKNKNNIKGYEEHGYFMVAPHQSIKVGGKEVSGTVMRDLLGSPKIDDKERPKLFKQAFGYYDKGIFNMMNNKFKKLYEVFEQFLVEQDIKKILESNSSAFPIDDGPPTFYDGFRDYQKQSKLWIDSMYNELGWELVSYILSDSAIDPGLDYTTRMGKVPTVAYGRRGAGPYGERFPSSDPVSAYKKWLEQVTKTLDFKIVKWLGLNDSATDVKGVPVESPALPGVQTGDQNTQRLKNLDLAPGDEAMGTTVDKLQDSYIRDVKSLLVEGGAYGHMSHPFDDKDLTFGDLKKIIELGLGGQLSREDNVTEKLDGQNLFVSFKDGKTIFARNKGQVKNFGQNALNVSGIISKFAGRGDISDAFEFAAKDLDKALQSLSDKQRTKIFNEGQHWMNLEVMWPKSSNVVNYDKAEIVFHGALIYDESGSPIGEVPGSGRILAGMVKQRNQNIQKKFKISSPVFLKVPKHQDFGKMKKKFLGRLSKLQKKYGLNNNDTLGLYHQKYWESFILLNSKKYKYKIPRKVLINLTKRWAFFDKSYKIPMMRKDIKNEKFLEWSLGFDKNNHSKQVKENMRPFEILFFEVGAEILKNVDGYMAANPNDSVQKMRKGVQKAVQTLRSKGDVKKLNTLRVQLDRLNSIGGLKTIVPSEGIVFKYNGKTYKFTGAFAPVNQIMGLLTF